MWGRQEGRRKEPDLLSKDNNQLLNLRTGLRGTKAMVIFHTREG